MVGTERAAVRLSAVLLSAVLLSLVLLTSGVSSYFRTADYCPHVNGTCQRSCDVSRHVTLEVRAYLCHGQVHCCVLLPDQRKESASSWTSESMRKMFSKQSHWYRNHQQQSAKEIVWLKGSFKEDVDQPHRTDRFQGVCGLIPRRLSRRVTGGSEARRCSLPWMVSLSRDPGNQQVCGGALVSDRHVVTAAHCLDRLNGFKPSLVLGDHEHTTSAYSVTRHPRYRWTDLSYDVAILTLDSPVQADGCIQPICLPSVEQTFPPGQTCAVAGWGSRSPESHSRSPVLLQARVSIVEPAVCVGQFGSVFHSSSQICAGDVSSDINVRDACGGDSGGPLMCPHQSDLDVVSDAPVYLAGVISAGADPCGQPGVPAVYTDVTSVLDWVYTVVNS